MRRRLVLLLPFLMLASAGASAPLLAAEPPQLEAGAPPLAVQRYQNGRQLYGAGDLAGAAAEFRSALTLFPNSAKLAFNLARVLERLGEIQEASSMYRRYLGLAPQAEDRANIEALAAALEARVEAERPRLVVSTLPAGATVFLDEVEAGQSPITLRPPPGDHVLRFTAAGHQSALRTVKAERAVTTPVAVELQRDAGAAVAATPAAPPPASTEKPAPALEVRTESVPPADDGPRWRKPVAYVALGLGAVGLGLGAYFTAQAADTADQANGLGVGQQDRYGRLNDDLSGQKLGMGVGYGLGVAGLGAGLALLLWPDAAEAK